MEKKLVKYTFFMFALLFSLVGCVVPTAETTSAISEATSEETPSNTILTNVGINDSMALWANSGTGLYYVQQVRPGGDNLFYIDPKTQQEIYLCGNPNCTHDSLSCNSFLPAVGNNYGYSLFSYQQKLYIVQGVQTDQEYPSIMQAQADGSDRKTLFSLADGQSFVGHIFGYGDELLFDVRYPDSDGKEHILIQKANVNTGTVEQWFSYVNTGNDYYILNGATERDLIFVHYNFQSNTAQYFGVSPEAQQVVLEEQASQMTFGQPFDGTTLNCSFQSPYLCELDNAQKTFSYTDCNTQDKKVFPAPQLIQGQQLTGVVHLFDDEFGALVYNEDGTTACLYLDQQNQSYVALPYQQKNASPYQVLATYQDQLFCIKGAEEVPLENQVEYGLQGETYLQQLFCFIRKSDFIAGVLQETPLTRK